MMKIVIPAKNSSNIYSLSDIEYLNSNGCYTEIYIAGNSRITSSKPISYYENLLKDYGFIRIHQKYLINKEHIKSILNGNPIRIKLKSETVLPVTRFKKIDLYKFFLY